MSMPKNAEQFTDDTETNFKWANPDFQVSVAQSSRRHVYPAGM